MLVKPAELIAPANAMASSIASPVAVNPTVISPSNTASLTNVSAISKLYDPGANVESVILFDLMTVSVVAPLLNTLNSAIGALEAL